MDYLTGVELSFSIFYLIPVTFVVWYAGGAEGVAIALLSASVWLAADIVQVQPNYISATVYWNALVRLGFFTIVVYLTDTVKKLNYRLETKVQERTADLTAEILDHRKAQIELKNKTEKLRELTKRIQNIREEENINIAREIHDELGQELTAIKINAAWISKKFHNNAEIVESLGGVISLVDDVIKSIRKISTRLRPRLLDELGLFPAVEHQLKDFQTKTGIECKLEIPENNIALSKEASSNLFRIFQEAITNVARHSHATLLKVTMTKGIDDRLVMDIKDNGVGLPDNYLDKSQSLGILGMKERALALKGSLEISSALEGGTSVLVCIPLNNKTKNNKND